VYNCGIRLRQSGKSVASMGKLRNLNLSHNSLANVKSIAELIGSHKIERLVLVNCELESQDVDLLLK
jgi:hypothetical protein